MKTLAKYFGLVVGL